MSHQDVSLGSPLSFCMSSSSSSHGGRLRLKKPTLKHTALFVKMNVDLWGKLFYSDMLCLLLARSPVWDKAPSAVQHIEVPSRRWCSAQPVEAAQRWLTLLSTTQVPPLVHLGVSILHLYVSRYIYKAFLMRSCLHFMIQTKERMSHLCFPWAAHLGLILEGTSCHLIVSHGVKNEITYGLWVATEIETEIERAMNIRWFQQMPSVWSLKFRPPLRRFVPTVCSSLSLWPSHLSAGPAASHSNRRHCSPLEQFCTVTDITTCDMKDGGFCTIYVLKL